MIAYIKGLLIHFDAAHALVEVNGMGYSVCIHCRLLKQLPEIGQPIQLYTSFVIREFSQTLYGFLESQERDIFDVLMNITGIGPKLALSLLGHLSFNELQTSVASQDFPTLCRVPGVGKKTAERLVVELKDKLPVLLKTHFSEFALTLPEESFSNHIQDALLALLNLGYNQNTAKKALKQTLKDLPETADLSLIITSALKHI